MKNPLVLLSVFLLGTVISAVAQDFPKEPGPTNVTFKAADGTVLRAHLALPPGQGTKPGVLLIHEWWGLNMDITREAEALAAEGFVVLAADGYRGQVAPDAATAQKLSQSTGATVSGDLDEALKFLEAQPQVTPGKVAVWGFCYGGSQAERLAIRTPDLWAVVAFYGGNPPQKAENLGVWSSKTPFLGVFGKQDGSIPVEKVRGFEGALEARGIPATVTRYPGVGHAFVKSTTYNQGGPAGQAWNQAVGFLKDLH